MVLLSIAGRRRVGARAPHDDGDVHDAGAAPAYWRRYEASFHAPVRSRADARRSRCPPRGSRCRARSPIRVAHRSARARLEAMRQRLAGDFVDARSSACSTAVAMPAPPLARDRGAGYGCRRAHAGPAARARDTSYRALRDEHRRARAAELLAQPGARRRRDRRAARLRRADQLRARLSALVRRVAASVPRSPHAREGAPRSMVVLVQGAEERGERRDVAHVDADARQLGDAVPAPRPRAPSSDVVT